MRRLEFVGGLGGAVAWPLVAQAQQPKHADIAPRLRRAASITAVGTAQKAGTANQHKSRCRWRRKSGGMVGPTAVERVNAAHSKRGVHLRKTRAEGPAKCMINLRRR
jgi:hypothetical protein